MTIEAMAQRPVKIDVWNNYRITQLLTVYMT